MNNNLKFIDPSIQQSIYNIVWNAFKNIYRVKFNISFPEVIFIHLHLGQGNKRMFNVPQITIITFYMRIKLQLMLELQFVYN